MKASSRFWIVLGVVAALIFVLNYSNDNPYIEARYVIKAEVDPGVGYEIAVNDVVLTPASHYLTPGQSVEINMNPFLRPGTNILQIVYWIPSNELIEVAGKATFKINEAILEELDSEATKQIADGEPLKTSRKVLRERDLETWTLNVAEFLKIAREKPFDNPEIGRDIADAILTFEKPTEDTPRFLGLGRMRFLPGRGLVVLKNFEVSDNMTSSKWLDSTPVTPSSDNKAALISLYEKIWKILDSQDIEQWKELTSERDSEGAYLMGMTLDDFRKTYSKLEHEVFTLGDKWVLEPLVTAEGDFRYNAGGRLVSLIDPRFQPLIQFRNLENPSERLGFPVHFRTTPNGFVLAR